MKPSKHTTVALIISSIVLLTVFGTQVLAWPPGCLPEECEYWDGYSCLYNCTSCQECTEGACIDIGCDCTGDCCGACCGACCGESSDECDSCPSGGGGGGDWGLGDGSEFGPGISLPGPGPNRGKIRVGFATAGDPVFVRTGEFKLYAADLFIDNPGLPVVAKRTYSNRHHRLGLFGYNWDVNYNMSLREIYDGEEVLKVQIFEGNACTHTYTRLEPYVPIFESDSDPGSYVQRYDGGMGMVSYKLHKKSGREYEFDILDWYQLRRILDPEYGAIEFTYDQGRLQTISDSIHGTITLSYATAGLVETITDSANRVWNYYYDGAKDLIGVQTPDGLATTYVYDSSHNMTAVYDPNGDLVVGNSYDGSDRVWYQTVGAGIYEFLYDEANNKTFVADREGHWTEMVYNESGQLVSRKVYTDDFEETFTVIYSYDEDTLRRTQVLYPRGNCIDYTYDDNGNLTGKYKKTDSGQPNDRQDPDVLATTYTYWDDPGTGRHNKVKKVTDPKGNETEYWYDDDGNLTKIEYPEVETPAPTHSFTYTTRGRIETETGPDGIVTKYEYYADDDQEVARRGKLYKVIKDYGTGYLNLTTEYDYDSYGNIETVKDPEDNTWTYEYNSMGKLLNEYAPDPFDETNVTEYHYDLKGNMDRITRLTGGNEDQVTSYLYSGANNLGTVTNPLGHETHYCYDKNDQLNVVIDAEGYTTETEYNERGLVTQVKAQVAEDEYEITQYRYDDNGNLIEMTDPREKITTYEYDLFDRLIKVTDPVGHLKMYEYDKLGNVIKETAWEHGDPANIVLMQTRTEYDALGRETRRAVMANPYSSSAINPSVDQVVDYSYNLAQRKSWVKTYYNNSSTPAITTYENDRAGRLARIEDPAGNETITTYYNDDRLASVVRTDQNPLEGGADLVMTTEFEYDNLGRITLQKEKESESTWQTTTFNPYDRLDNLLQITAPDGVITTYEYDLAGQLEVQTADYDTQQGINQKTEYTYDNVGRIETLTSYANGSTAQTTTYEYDGLGRVKKITYPDTKMIEYEYWPGGRVKRRTDQRGIVTDYDYDDNSNLLTKTVDGNGQTDNALETFTYDGLGRMLSAVKTFDWYEVSTTEFAYTGIGKIDYTDETLFDDPTYGTKRIDYGYDQAGFRTQTKYPNPWGADSLVIHVTPDWQGRIATLKVNNDTYNRVQYDYIGSRVKRRTYRPAVIVPLVSDTDYDNLGRVTEIKATRMTPSPTTPVQFGYEYQQNSRDIWKQTYVHRNPQDPPQVQFDYDNLDRLTSVTYGMDSTSESFTMDQLGNRDRATPRGGSSVEYDVDNLTNRYTGIGGNSQTYDFAGNLTEDRQDYTYYYDYENRLVRIRKPNADVADFYYDALGRRICKFDWQTWTGVIYYNNGNWQVLCEYDALDGDFLRWYAYGNGIYPWGIDEVLIKGTSYLAGTFQYYLHDHLYSPVAITSGLGTTLERYEYDAYGNPHALDPTTYAERPLSNSLSRYLFTGRELDILDYGSLKIQYNRNRYYDSYTGRWTTHDPRGIIPGYPHIFSPGDQYEDVFNLYEYVRSNPAMFIDPYGEITNAECFQNYRKAFTKGLELSKECHSDCGASPVGPEVGGCAAICAKVWGPWYPACVAGCEGAFIATKIACHRLCSKEFKMHSKDALDAFERCVDNACD